MSVDWYALIAPAGALALGLVGYGYLRHRYALLDGIGAAAEPDPVPSKAPAPKAGRRQTRGGGGLAGPKEDRDGGVRTVHSPVDF